MSKPQNWNDPPKILNAGAAQVFTGKGAFSLFAETLAGAWTLQVRLFGGSVWVSTDTVLNSTGVTSVMLAEGFQYRLNGGTGGNVYLGKSEGGGGVAASPVSSADIRTAVNAYLAANPLSGGPALLTMNAFITNAAGVSQGAAQDSALSYTGSFLVRVRTTAAAPRPAIVLPTGRRLSRIYNATAGGVLYAPGDSDSGFAVDPNNAQRFIGRATRRPSNVYLDVRTTA